MSTQQLQVYQCESCGNMVEVLHAAGGQLACCGQPLTLMAENTTDAAVEKHVPVIEPVEGGVKIKVGSVPHPMQDDHWIEWLELIVDGKSYRQFFDPGEVAEACFPVDGEQVAARQYCNLHGLWKAQ